jgi:hypothetical protein
MQEENRILEKTNRQKVLEVEKLSQTIQELEEAILAGGAAANAIRDYQRQIEELHVCIKVISGDFKCSTQISNHGIVKLLRRKRRHWKGS